MAWLKRTGLRRLAAQCSASNAGVGPALSTVVMIGMLGLFGANPAERRPQFGQHRVDDRVMRCHIDVDPARQPVPAGDHRDQLVDLLGRAGDHRLAR